MSWRSARPMRALGFALGLVLLLLAIGMVWRGRSGVGAALEAAMPLEVPRVFALAACVLVNLILSGLFFSVLIARYGRVGLVEMQAMIATSSLMNYLPLRPGLFGRLAWHRAMHGIHLADGARMVVEGALVSGGTALAIGAAVLASALVGQPAMLAFALVVAMIAITLALAGVCRAPGVGRLALAALLRSADAAVWAIRYHLAFSLIGAPVRPGAAIAFACAGMLAGLVPIIGNGLGVREWAIGLLSPLLTTSAIALGVTAELVNRAVETLVIVAAGSAGALYLAWRRSAARTGAGGAAGATASSSSTAKSDSNE